MVPLDLDTEKILKRFEDYISYNTQSDEENDQVYPSTPGQMVLARHLKEELEQLGLQEVSLDENGYVMATAGWFMTMMGRTSA